MKRAEVQIPEALYQQLEGLAAQLHLTVCELVQKAAIEIVHRMAKPPTKPNGDWRFPEARHLGPFVAPVEDWRLLANEASD
jgi:hypothetical protein